MKNQVKCTIVMYHYVRNMHGTAYPNIHGRLVKDFIGQLKFILRNYAVISLEDYVDFLHGNRTIPANSCILTFDDGLKDHYRSVFPILKERKLSASFFPITKPLISQTVSPVHKAHFLLAKLGSAAFVNEFNYMLTRDFPDMLKWFVEGEVKKEPKYRWDNALTANLKWTIATMPSKPKAQILNQLFTKHFNEKEFSRELYMNWDEMREMAEESMSFGSHSHTHPALAELTREEQISEAQHSKEILERELKIKVQFFSYPYGSFNEGTVRILKRLEYACGLTTNLGINEGKNVNPYTLNRLDTNDLPFTDKGD